MVRYYGLLSPTKQRLLEDVVYLITETMRKTAMQIKERRMWQGLLKVVPHRLTEPDLMHGLLARMRWYS